LYPTGSVNCPTGGGAIVCGFSSSTFEVFFRPFRPIRFAISVLASVVSEGSPGSDPFGILSPMDERNRFEGGFDASIELPFLCFKVDSGAVDEPSSPEASLDDVCS
jgi:hypothetical protein